MATEVKELKTEAEEMGVDELRSTLEELGERAGGLARAEAEDRGDNWSEDIRETRAKIGAYDATLTAKLALERSKEERKGPEAAYSGGQGPQTLGQRVVEHENFKSFNPKEQHFRVQLDDIEVRNILASGENAGDSGFFTGHAQPVAPITNQTALVVRDLLSVQSTNFNSVPIIRELNATANEGGASAVAEASAKPEVTAEFSQINVAIETIAGWLQASRQILEDAETLRGYVDTRLIYMTELELQRQILNGNGTSPNLDGLLPNATDVVAGGTAAESLALGIAEVERANTLADGIVMHPTDFWAMVSARHANQFDGGFGGNSPFGGPPNVIWGLPVVRTQQQPVGTALVGSFRMGATLFVRREAVVRTTESHASTFVSNIITLLAELRAGLGIHRPDYFADVDLLA